MNIEVTNAGFSNKGANLMLDTVCRRLRQRFPAVKVCMPNEYESFEDRATQAIYLTVRSSGGSLRRRIFDTFTKVAVKANGLSSVFGLVPANQLDAMIDISGYGFGDKWDLVMLHRTTAYAKALKERGKPSVLLPQMLGPFTKPGQAEGFRELGKYVDLIYAREKQSFEHAAPLVSPEKLRLAPDITITAKPVAAPEFENDYVCLVPNIKLLENNNPQQQQWAPVYVKKLVAAADFVRSQGYEVKILQHEYSPAETAFVDRLVSELKCDRSDVVRHRDPLMLKSILGGARLVVGSRFHALVSSLSMEVPVIALGWAHKYDELLKDFGIPGNVHFADSPVEELVEQMRDCLNRRDEYVAILSEKKSSLAAIVEEMWEDVFAVLGGKPSASGDRKAATHEPVGSAS